MKGFFLNKGYTYFPTGLGKKEPPIKSGGPNQKPLTIKPYPMKIQC